MTAWCAGFVGSGVLRGDMAGGPVDLISWGIFEDPFSGNALLREEFEVEAT